MFFFNFLFFRAYLEFGDIPTKEFTQKLDHFSVNTQTFKQRYYENYEYGKLKEYKTAIIYIGGEGPLTASSISNGSILELAKRTNSALFSLEHRYFGASQPFDNLETENLIYLTIQQALADLANFIDQIVLPSGQPNTTVKIFVVGGSYPGSLSSWFRLKYPQYAYASWSSSAPVLIKNDFFEYDAYIATQLEHVSKSCLDKTKETLDLITERVKTDKEKVIKEYGFEGDLTNEDIIYAINDVIAAMVQYNSKYQLLNDHCQYQESGGGEEKLKVIIKQVLEARGETITDFVLTNGKDTDVSGPYASIRSWSYMTCKQVGWFQTASSKLRSSLINLDYFRDACETMFGDRTLADEEEMNRYFGGNDPQQTRVFFLNGDVDPWNVMGVHQADESLLRRAIMIANESHCADLVSINENNTVLHEAQEAVLSQMVEWIQEESCNNTCVHGKCVMGGCICENNWGGQHCDYEIKSKEAFDYAIILGVSLPVVVAVIIIFCSWIFCYRRRKPLLETHPLLTNN